MSTFLPMKLLYLYVVKYFLTLLCFFLFIVPFAALVSAIILVTVPVATFIGTVNELTVRVMNAFDQEISKIMVINKIREVREKYFKDI